MLCQPREHLSSAVHAWRSEGRAPGLRHGMERSATSIGALREALLSRSASSMCRALASQDRMRLTLSVLAWTEIVADSFRVLACACALTPASGSSAGLHRICVVVECTTLDAMPPWKDHGKTLEDLGRRLGRPWKALGSRRSMRATSDSTRVLGSWRRCPKPGDAQLMRSFRHMRRLSAFPLWCATVGAVS